MVYSVLQELARMDRLHSAIAGRNPQEVIPLITFLRKYANFNYPVHKF